MHKIILRQPLPRTKLNHHHQRLLLRGSRPLFHPFSSLSTTSSSSSTPAEDKDGPRVIMEPDAGNPQILHVRLNRPDKLNALNLEMFHAIRAAIVSLHHEPKYKPVRVIILSGMGRAFCSGLDVPSLFSIMTTTNTSPTPSSSSSSFRLPNPLATARELLERPPPSCTASASTSSSSTVSSSTVSSSALDIANIAQSVAYGWRTLPVPVLCVVHGVCFGAGLQIALGADVRIATTNSTWSILENKYGLIPDMSASITLRELVRIDVAKELTFTGRKFGGQEAYALGLVTRVVDGTREAADTYALELAQQICDASPDATALAKRLFQETFVQQPSERMCLLKESEFQGQLLATWNQVAASSRSLGWKLPYTSPSTSATTTATTTILQHKEEEQEEQEKKS